MPMRARKKKNCEARVNACSDLLISEPSQMNDYKEKLPAEIEIGCGKGGFVCELAKRNPDKFYFAVELVTDVLVTALERAKDEEITNVRFLNVNALRLPEFFAEGEISKIYLNFSDPWPKSRHDKRRLTYREFLKTYKKFLAKGGLLVMKTDNDNLFDFTLEELSEADFRLDVLSRDLHNSEYNEGNIMTEYEKNFSEKGVPIKYLRATNL
jgi:tRNA (guanine-N7-)-methyltransferase